MDTEFLRHHFEDRHDGVIIKNKFKLGVRHLQTIYMLVVAATFGALRGSTGVAVTALTDPSRRNDSYIQIQDWDSKVQGAILSSYLFGYALMLVPAELYLRKVGGKHVITLTLLVSGVLAVAMPTIVSKGGWIAVCNTQLWIGAAQGCFTPSNQWLLARFLPPSERGILGFLVHSGTIIGIIIGLSVSGVISEARLGWELIFYSQAMLALSVACIWGLLTASSPDQHQAMGDTEKEFIKEAQSGYRKKIQQVPWRCILESRQFWAVSSTHVASNTVFVFVLFYAPAYLQTFGASLREVTWKAMFPFLSFWFIRVTTAPTIDWFCRCLRINFQVNVIYLRKFINVIGACCVVTGLTILPHLTPDWSTLALVVLSATLGMIGFQFCGFLETYKDMSENYNGTLMILSRAVASLCGAFVPIMTGTILEHGLVNTERWRPVFLYLASVYVICNVIFIAFGSSKRQYWDCIVVKTFGYQNTMIDNQLELDELNDTKKRFDYDNANTVI